jgi:hypothetical protein
MARLGRIVVPGYPHDVTQRVNRRQTVFVDPSDHPVYRDGSLGRVASQANANNGPGNNTTWNYYFAGYRSEENDAYGTQHVLYYTRAARSCSKSRTLRDWTESLRPSTTGSTG